MNDSGLGRLVQSRTDRPVSRLGLFTIRRGQRPQIAFFEALQLGFDAMIMLVLAAAIARTALG